MRIALDYDKTFTGDRALFSEFVMISKRRGHDIKFVTARYGERKNDDIERDAMQLGIDIVYTDGRKKKPLLSDMLWTPDIWVDDDPDSIVAEKRRPSATLI
ncbi:hypothetical protein [Vibrio navarrensis]|uniref:hypothetical protein n=1 Tax=Vibrio navarrensis TaxID=29495 RepID=UPI001558800A|nr:hypothetical protein [Vibrio navarrensis]